MSDREQFILQKLYQEKRIKVNELSELLGVTPETIRKDLSEMEEKKLLQRVHGGAVVPSYFKSDELPYAHRSESQLEAKQKIVAEVAKDILTGESIIIDNGSTCYELAKLLAERSNLTIITPSLKIASLFTHSYTSKVFLLGGWLRFTEPSTGGSVTLNTLRQFNVNKTILSIAGISAETGLTEYLEEDATSQRQAIACGEKIIVMADHTKFDTRALLSVAPVESVDEIYVDRQVDSDKIKQVKEKGVKIIMV